MKEPEYRLCVDMKSGRPGCVLLQALGGEGDYNWFLSAYTDIWLVAPTPDMGWVRGPESLFKKLFDLNLKEKKEAKKAEQ